MAGVLYSPTPTPRTGRLWTRCPKDWSLPQLVSRVVQARSTFRTQPNNKNSNDTSNGNDNHSSNNSIIMLMLIIMKKKGEREEEEGRRREEKGEKKVRPTRLALPHFPDAETEAQSLAAPMSPCSHFHPFCPGPQLPVRPH